jgi:hypothetical protein
MEYAPGFGQVDPPGGALEQPRMQVVLQFGDVPGHGCGGQIEPLGRFHKAHGFNNLSEYPKGLESIHDGLLSRNSGEYINNCYLYPDLRERETGGVNYLKEIRS